MAGRSRRARGANVDMMPWGLVEVNLPLFSNKRVLVALLVAIALSFEELEVNTQEYEERQKVGINMDFILLKPGEPLGLSA